MKGALPLIALVMIGAVLAGGAYLFASGGITASVFNGCTWQEDYWWVTCQEVENYQKNLQVGGESQFVCPTGADVSRCKILSSSASDVRDCASCNLGCSGCVSISAGSYISPGRTIAIWSGSGSANVQVLKKELRSCGAAACSQSGEPIVGAQGCSWKPQTGSNIPLPGGVDLTKIDAIDTVAVGQSYKYVYSQHLVSCPQQCEPGKDDLGCTVPTSGRSGQTLYNGKTYNYYVSGSQLNIVGCKAGQSTTQCILYNDDYSQCLKTGSVQNGQCGTIAALSAGQCSQNSDCGDTTRNTCVWDSTKLQGICQPIQVGDCDSSRPCPTNYVCQSNKCILSYQPECQFDFQCTQTAPTCNSKQYGAQKCVSGKCTVVSQQVDCCSSSDCAAGYFCNSQFKCEKSQVQQPDCPAGQCCERRISSGDTYYKDRTCSSMTGGAQSVCCGDGSCASKASECKSGCGFLDIACWFSGLFSGLGDLFSGIFGALLVVLIVVVIIIFGYITIKVLGLFGGRR